MKLNLFVIKYDVLQNDKYTNKKYKIQIIIQP